MGDALRLTLGWVAEAVGGSLRAADPRRAVGNVVADTRIVQAGECFVALRGARFDGHDFVGEAFAKGAAAAIVERGFAGTKEGGRSSSDAEAAALEGRDVIEVADTTKALQDLARAVRRASGARVVAITGSAGKTTTKETIATFLSGRFRVAKNKGNLNNHIGLPLSLLQLRDRPDVAVMELGMNHAGEISTLVAIAEPETRVWTNVGDAHIGFFSSLDAIADAKAEILEGAQPGHLLVCNADDPRISARVGRFAGRTVSFGASSGAAVRVTEVENRGLQGTCARLVTPAGERRLSTPLVGLGNLSNVLAATAVALEFGVPLDDIVVAAGHLQPADRRGVVRRLAGGVLLLDDSYNASPTAVSRALEVIAAETRVTRRVAVLGEMLELGDQALALHQSVGRAAAAAGLGLLFTVGGASARALAAAAVEAGMPPSAVRHAETSQAAAADVVGALQAGDLVLVKGSRGTRTDLVVDRVVQVFG